MPINTPNAVNIVFENVAAFWVETLFIRRKLRAGSWRRFVALDDEDLIRSIAESPRGALLVTSYFGNLAVGVFALGQMFRPIHAVIDENVVATVSVVPNCGMNGMNGTKFPYKRL